MRARLLDATIACLFERGYARTTTTEIAERAGASRGAQLHHFPTKADLVTTAVDWLFARRVEEFRAAFAKLPESANRAEAAIDILWSMFSGPTFYAWLELVVAARTDADLRRRVVDINMRFLETVERTFRDLFPEPESPNAFFEIAPLFTFSVLDGLALHRIASTDEAYRERILRALKALSQLAIPSFSPTASEGGSS